MPPPPPPRRPPPRRPSRLRPARPRHQRRPPHPRPRPSPRPPPPPPGEDTINIFFPNTPIEPVLALYEQLTGKTLIRDSNLNTGVNFSFGPEPKRLTRPEAIAFIESTLLFNNFAFVPVAPGTVKILNIAAGKAPRSEGPPLFPSLSALNNALPDGEHVASLFMPLSYIPASDALTVFNQVIAPHPYASLVAVTGVNALIITENTLVLRKLDALRELIDQPSANVIPKFITLRRADAERVTETITKIIQDNAQPGSSSASSNPSVPPAPGLPPGLENNSVPGSVPSAPASASAALSERKLVPGEVKLFPDTRTNRILVIARRESLPIIENLIMEFDRAVDLAKPYERFLQYIPAGEVLPVLSSILSESKEDANAASGATSGASNNTGLSTPAFNPTGSNGFGNNNSFGGNNSSGSRTGGSGLGDALGAPNADNTPVSVIIGKTRLIANKKANSILVIGPPESIDKADKLLDRLDQRPLQVYLSTVIGQLTLGDDREMGVSFLNRFKSLRANGYTGGIAGSSINSGGGNATTGFLDTTTLVNPAAFLNAAGLSLYGTIADSLDIYVSALESTNRFNILARPSIYTSNNKKATISSGRSVPVPTSTTTSVSNGNSTDVNSSIGYQDVELKLEVVPLINANREVTLDIAQQNNSITGNTTISGNQVPNIATQNIITTVTVPDRSTIVLGGLISEDKTNDRSGVPGLSRIPILGALFRSTTKKTSRQELIILIQPTVIGTTAEMINESDSQRARTGISFDSIYNPADTSAPPTDREVRRALPVN